MVTVQTLRRAAASALLFLSAATMAGSVATDTLLAPLAPGNQTGLSFSMPPGFAPDQKVWVAYDIVALSPDDADSGGVTFEQSFELVATSISDLYVTLRAGDLESSASAGTIAQRLEEVAGQRSPEELRSLLGDELYAAYEAVNAGTGRILTGRIVKHLPAPGRSDTPLAVSVQRAEGLQPLAVTVTVGQGDLPLEFQQKPQDSMAYKAGYIAGLAAFGWLVMRFFRRRRQD